MPKPLELQEDFISLALGFGISISVETRRMFAAYERELIAWNKRMNLIAKGDEGKVWTRHFLDSLAGWSLALPLIPYPLPLTPVVLDIGTGAGFPGLPIKLVWPEIRLTLLESVRKKTLFLKHLGDGLKLRDVPVVCARAEDLAKVPEHRGQYDFVLARAVSSVEELRKLGFTLLKPKGSLIAWRGEESIVHQLSCSYRLPGEARKRHILILNKEEKPMGVDSARIFC